ncbi:hypothetical protein OGAPHI_003287 [Ogataea philodendri]|uniref:Trafficking protein particle complex II-specific subunit 130 n=1 Tax=Ogataea philodendri TaxID=1378263 RepID=A0A9P8P777_9ASCO|nr:uncharacterized protein OGAPHI_003287 [Ogataea philodendri]KAH3666838.1 hypothetical protein OGAPHI_003287 [Ogataea philodendri]
MNQSKGPIPLKVGYYDPFAIFPRLKDDLDLVSKLDKLHWKPNQSASVRTINNIKLHYVPSSDNHYLNFIFINSTSLDEYRAKVRPVVKQWLNNIRALKPACIYFIILYEDSSQVSRTDKLLKTNLLTKLKTDFVHDELPFDTIFKIKSSYPSPADKKENWTALLGSIRAGLTEAFGYRLTYFQSKDSLSSLNNEANLYMDLGQLEDALDCFERMFVKVNRMKIPDGLEEATVDQFPLAENNIVIDFNSKFKLKAYFFKQQTVILRDSATTEASFVRNQIRWIHLLLSFIRSFDASYRRNELSLALIDDYLSSKQLQQLLRQTDRDLSELYEKLGDLRLLNRNELIKLAHSKKYVLSGSLVEIPLSDEPYELIAKVSQTKLASEKTFHQIAVQDTKDAIEAYSKSQARPRTVDTLSTELALIYFHNMKELETSSEILSDSFTYFKNSDWEFITLGVLKILIENLEQLSGNHGDVLPVLLGSYLELVAKDEPFEKDKLDRMLASLTEKVNFVSTELFECKLDTCIDAVDVDVYGISVQITSKIEVAFDEMIITFDKASFRLANGKLGRYNTFVLTSGDLTCGVLEAQKIIIRIGQLEIQSSLKGQVFAFQIEQFHKDGQLQNNTVLEAVVPRVRHLNKDEIMLVARVGSRPVEDCSFVFYKTDIDRLVAGSTYVVEHEGKQIDAEIESTPDKLVFQCHGQFAAGTTALVRIPYFFPPEVANTLVSLSYGLAFAGHAKHVTTQLDTQLHIAVSVQDIFKSSKLFSNYSINSPVLNQPVRIQTVELTSRNSTVKTWQQPHNIVAFNDQGSTFFYKIESLNDESLNLQIDYNNIKDEMVCILERLFTAQIMRHSPRLVKYLGLLRALLRAQSLKVNHYALTGNIRLDPLDVRRHHQHLDRIKQEDLADLVREIRLFFESSLEVAPELRVAVLEEVHQQLNIVVTVPTINTINIVEFEFDKQLQYLVCEPIHARLLLNVVLFKLEEKENKKVRFQNEPEVPTDVNLRLELLENENNWLVSGIKNFELDLDLRNDKSLSYAFDLVLTPLRVGKLELPRVEIKNRSDFQIQMELDYKNSSESVLVVSELNKVTYSF